MNKSWCQAEVVVAGGGPAGVAAAVTAARLGARTLLVERYGFLGGAASAAMVVPWGGVYLHNEKITCAIFDEIMERMLALGGAAGYAFYSGTTRGWGGCYVPFDPEVLKSVLQELALGAGVQLLLHAQVDDAVLDRRRIARLTLGTREGRLTVCPRIVVDATGDADVAARAGLACDRGRPQDGRMQPMTLMARLDRIETERLRAYIAAHPEEFAWRAFPVLRRPPSAHTSPSLELEEKPLAASGFISLLAAGRKSGALHFGRTRFLVVSGLRPGELYLNASRVAGKDGTKAEDLTFAEQDARRQIVSLVDYLRQHAPGFRNTRLLATGCQIGVRETRRIRGRATLTLENIMGGRARADVIARGCYPVDIHEVDGQWGSPAQKEGIWIDLARPYDIPFGCLVARDADNLLAAGRCLSATHEAAGSARIQPTCMATGQAAGVAAALALKTYGGLEKVDIGDIQQKLDIQRATGS